jgi:hypothetical protein
MGIKIVQRGNKIYATGNTFAGNFLIAIGILCYIFAAISIAGTTSTVLALVPIFGSNRNNIYLWW